MGINLSNTECLVKLDSVIATKVANFCPGSADWEYCPFPTLMDSVIGHTIGLVVLFSFFLILFTVSVFITK